MANALLASDVDHFASGKRLCSGRHDAIRRNAPQSVAMGDGVLAVALY
jgi:hypothetical protein